VTWRIEQGDCLEFMAGMDAGSIDAIITDLPYGTTACKWDVIIPFVPMWAAVKRVLKPRGAFVTTASQPFTSALVMSNTAWFKYCWVWEKTKASDFLNAKNKPMKAHEDIVVFSDGTTANCSPLLMTYNPQMENGKSYVKQDRQEKRVGPWPVGNRKPFELRLNINDGERFPRSVLHIANPNNGSDHPTQKPVALYTYLIRAIRCWISAWEVAQPSSRPSRKAGTRSASSLTLVTSPSQNAAALRRRCKEDWKECDT
jgi:site-specific DNA-methyltransferase (adenine-specific)